jgi:hypothetical protein
MFLQVIGLFIVMIIVFGIPVYTGYLIGKAIHVSNNYSITITLCAFFSTVTVIEFVMILSLIWKYIFDM